MERDIKKTGFCNIGTEEIGKPWTLVVTKRMREYEQSLAQVSNLADELSPFREP